MPIKFSKAEQAFIDDKLDANAIEDFLVKNIGNMELNNRVYQELNPKQNKLDGPLTHQNSNKDDNLQLLERWTYKTPTAQEIKSIATKIKIAKQLQAQGIVLLPEEKISLLELKQISRFSLLLGKKDSFREGDEENTSAKDLFTSLQSGQGTTNKKPFLEFLSNESTNKEFKELYDNMVVCEELAADLRRNIIAPNIYQAGDILIRNEAKSAVIENVAQEGITSLKEKDTVILFDKNIDDSYINDAFEEAFIDSTPQKNFKIEKKSESLEDYENAQKSNFKPSSSAVTDISQINVTDILSSDIYRLPKDKLNQTLINQIQQEKDPKKLEALLIKNGAEKVPNSIAEEFVRTEDVKKSKTFNNIEDNLANTLETLAKSATNPEAFVAQARPRIEAYLAVADLENNKTTPNVTAIDTELNNLYLDRNKSGIKAEIIKFISSTLVTLGLKKSTAEKTIQKISGKFTGKVLHSREHSKGNKKIEH
jgi:hypothetical protein